MTGQSAANTASSDWAETYWSSLTDDDLDGVIWLARDPLSLPNIQPVAPEELGHFVVEAEYKLDTGTDQPVPCAHCRKHTPHWHGFVLLTEDGRRFLLGSTCGPEAYGADYLAASSARNEKRRRHEAILRWRRVQEHLTDNIRALAAIERSAAFRGVSTARGTFEARASRTLARLRSLRPNTLAEQIELTAVVTVRDRAAEQARDAKFLAAAAELVPLPNKEHREKLAALRAELRPNEPLERTEVQHLGILQGWRWILEPVSPVQKVRDVLARLTALSILGSTTTDKTTTKIEQSARMAEHDLPDAAKALALIGEAGAFFGPANLKNLAKWASAQSNWSGYIEVDGGRLHIRDPLGDPVALALPPNWAAPDPDLLIF